MANLLNLDTFSDSRGNLTVIERIIPFEIKRLFYIYGVDSSVRGKHRHRKTIQAAICLVGRCTISSDDGKRVQHFVLDNPRSCVLLEPEDWHLMYDFSQDAILMVLASENYDAGDYIFEPYRPFGQLHRTTANKPELVLQPL